MSAAIKLLYKRKLFCAHKGTYPSLTVSGYALTEYEINFCKKCNRLFWKLTKPFNG